MTSIFRLDARLAERPVGMRVNVGCELHFSSPAPVPLVAQVLPRADDPHIILRESRSAQPVDQSHVYLDSFGNRCWRILAPAGDFSFRYDADVKISGKPDLVVSDAVQAPVEDLPDDLLAWTLPSRYILSDILGSTAWDLFGTGPTGWARVQAICDWIHAHIEFRTASTTPATTSLDVYHQRYGVCRDFAHLGITMCRALNIPARYVFGYMPDIGIEPADVPMDFHSWFEAYLGGQWHTFDARLNTPRIGRIPIGRGRDALDVAIVTQYGPGALTSINVWSDALND
jgi:transglutaminase-like putative cysteine protease